MVVLCYKHLELRFSLPILNLIFILLLPFSKKCGRSFFCRSLKSTTPTTPTTTEKNKNAQILAQKTKKHLNQYTVTQTNLYNYLLVYC